MRVLVASLLLLMVVVMIRPASAQDPPPRIGPFVIDLHASVPTFPNEDPQVAQSRGMTLAELPGAGWGMQVGVHLYLPRIKAITFGVGGEFAAGRARQTPLPGGMPSLRSSEERFTTIAPQLSLNFGTGRGWSYLSGGIGRSTWAIVPDGQEGFPPDSDPIKTINYGGGARWFMKSHLAFSFDVRFYAINPGAPYQGFPGTPRTTLLVIGAGASVK
jgi:hypothetical protein